MLFDTKVRDIIPDAEEVTNDEETKRKIQEISRKRKLLLNGEWVRAAVEPAKAH